MKPLIDLWAGFLSHEGFEPKIMHDDDILDIIELAEELTKLGEMKAFRSYKQRLETRKLIVETAFDLGIDLLSMKHKWKRRAIINRGLLDAWNKYYAIRFGSTYGTSGRLEAIRRDVKTKLAKKRKSESS